MSSQVEYNRRWRAKNPEKWRAANQRASRRACLKQYGLTLEDFDALLDAQNGLCGICACADPPRGWCVDHDHETGVVRGILCHECNLGLGKFKDRSDLLERALHWLQ